MDFWDNQRQKIHDAADNNVFYGLTHYLGKGYPCVKFHYIGKHHYWEISREAAHDMYVAIGEYEKQSDPPSEIQLERIDINEYDGEDCFFELFYPFKNDKKVHFYRCGCDIV